MQIIENTLDFHIDQATAVAIGKFDGIHKGHAQLIKPLFSYKKQGLKTCIVTFSISPLAFVKKQEYKENGVLTTNEEKRTIFSEMGIDYYVELPFDERVMQISAEQFLKQILLERMNMEALVCGTDCSFGRGGLGNVAYLQSASRELGFQLSVVEKLLYEGREISSSFIREELEAGRIEKVNDMLFRPFLFYGEVVYGRQIGRTLGMPTINLIPREEKLLPPNGVYYSRVNYLGTEYRAITNLGTKPTIDGEKPQIGVETYLYNFSEEIYGDNVYVSLYHFVRSEMKFDTIEALKNQMEIDIAAGRIWHEQHL